MTDQVHELFSKSGDVKRIIIGLDKIKKTACGFCFVEYPLKSVTQIKNSLWLKKIVVLTYTANTQTKVLCFV